MTAAKTPDQAANREFEDQVRRTAEAIWRLEPGACQPEHYSKTPPLSELDGIVRLPDVTHVIMVTTSTKLAKVESDVKKLVTAANQELRRGVSVVKWLITERQLEAPHVNHASKHGVTAITIRDFRARFFNSSDYISRRKSAAFGSARNLADGSISIKEDEYVDLPMTASAYNPVKGEASFESPQSITVPDLVERLRSGNIFVVIAPFGSGKSLTTREIFLRLAPKINDLENPRVPLTLNLREHWGQLYADEVLERHARSLGITPRENLTMAWRSGIAVLLLDGFDEVASQAVARTSDQNFMRNSRHDALRATRDLITNAPKGTGILVCGRDHYFDNHRELVHSLGLTGRAITIVRLAEFSEDQAVRYLRKYTGDTRLPDWLPRKPLILGYLAHRRLLSEILSIDASRGFGYAWDNFLRLVCEREASHDLAVMDAETVRRLLERLASLVRSTSSGTGPISGIDLSEAYRLETGDPASEGVLMQLQRLPGLTPREQDPGSRSFIDEDFLAALQGSLIARMILEGSDSSAANPWLTGLSPSGIAMAAYLVRAASGDANTALATAMRHASDSESSGHARQAAADALSVAIELAKDDGLLDCKSLVIEGAHIVMLDLEEVSLSHLFVRHSVIENLYIGMRLGDSTGLLVSNCLLNEVHGVSSKEALPTGIFQDCAAAAYDDASTNAAVLKLRIPPALKALVTVLRKLYLQAGGGRKLAAFKRGLSNHEIAGFVDDVLRILETEGIVAISGDVAHPIRRQTSRVSKILAELSVSSDPVVQKTLRLE